MITFLFELAALAGQIMFQPVPATVVPRTELERLVLAREENASRLIEDWLAAHPETAEQSLLETGFRRIRPDDACANYVYTRQIGPTIDRGVSVIMCSGERPFVLRTDEGRGPFVAPSPNAHDAARVPPAPKR